jgi:cytoskeletal protein CcmA (bactofilin family)
MHAQPPLNRETNMTDAHTTIIAPDTLIRGELIFQNAAIVLGKVEGKIISQGQLQLGQGSECKASVQAGTLIIDGTVEGDVVATERLELNTTAQIKGDVVAAKLIVAEGASFSGHCLVGPDAVKRATQGQVPVVNTDNKVRSGIKPGHHGSAPAPAVTVAQNGELENSLAGLESKLAGFSRTRNGSAASSGVE